MTQRPWLYLASQSPRRRQLLELWGAEPRLLLPTPGEDVESLEEAKPREAPVRYVQRVTSLKLEAAVARLAAQGLPPGPVLCADTTVAIGKQMLGKPASAAQAFAMLRCLSGQNHRVLTAVAVSSGGVVHGALSVSTVRFKPLTDAEISAYIDSGEPMGKAGAYGIQGLAGLWVERISGSYTGIMGLPAYETAQVLQAAGLRLL